MIAQSGHAIAEFSNKFKNIFEQWHSESNYLIILEIDNEEKLQRLYYKLQDNGADVVAFNEPDIDNQLTAICYYGTPELRKYTDKLNLALKN